MDFVTEAMHCQGHNGFFAQRELLIKHVRMHFGVDRSSPGSQSQASAAFAASVEESGSFQQGQWCRDSVEWCISCINALQPGRRI